jgi:hypothetical protein
MGKFSHAAWAVSLVAFAAACGGGASAPTTGSGGAPPGSGGSSGQCAAGLDACGTVCVDLQTTSSDCGACGAACPKDQVCRAGRCACPSGLASCGGACVDVASNSAHCGQCDKACAMDQVCSLGACSSSCANGLTKCDSSCVNTQESLEHCGGCGKACSADKTCQAGSCSCRGAGQTACANGCADTQKDPLNCGSCLNACGPGQSCTSGTCTGGTETGGAGHGTGGATSSGASSGGSTTALGGTGNDPSGGTTSDGGESVPNGLPGVVIDKDETADGVDLECVPLCQESEHPDDDVPDDDWAYEGYACVLRGTATADFNQTCTTGEAIPERNTDGLPGVVLDGECKVLCEGTQPGSADYPDWGWEYQSSCVIAGTPTGQCNLGCTTGTALPDLASVRRPGIMIDKDGTLTCVALCECEHTCTPVQIEKDGCDAASDWQWEYQDTCIVPGSTTATDKPACTTNEVQSFVPPAVNGSHPGFYTEAGKLYDANGREFVIRGVNNPHAWFDPDNQYLAYGALDTIASYKTNTIRVVWSQDQTALLLAQVLYRIVELKMIPLVELHDATGKTDTASLQAAANYYLQADVKKVLNDFRGYLLVNIANEWSGDLSAYESVVSSLRAGGIQHTLVIDASGYGQDINSIIGNAPSLLSGDSGEGKLLFSIHMYGQFGSASAVTDALERAQGASIPMIVGEFGPQLSGANVAWATIVSECETRKMGYIPWSWKGNSADTANLDMAQEWKGPLTQWGQDVMVNHNASIQKTAQPASIFQ